MHAMPVAALQEAAACASHAAAFFFSKNLHVASIISHIWTHQDAAVETIADFQ